MFKVPREFIKQHPNSLTVWLEDEKGRRVYLNLSKMAKAVGVDGSYLSHIFRGRRTPSLKTMMKIAEILNLTTEELFELIQYRRIAA